jgi:hypothetical protein
MSYGKVVLTDGTEVLFIVPDDPQATGTTDADTHQSDTTCLSAAIAAEGRVIASGETMRMRRAA